MYITNNPGAGVMQTTNNYSECSVCESPCEIQWTGQINVLGFIFALVCVSLYLVRQKDFPMFFSRRKKKIAKKLKIAFWVFFALFFLYIFNINYQDIGETCLVKGMLLEIKFWPKGITPWF